MKTVSCGILIVDSNHNILIGHSSGNTHWDIPKGTVEHNESHIECAIRETSEEFNIDVPRSELIDLGMFEYNVVKSLHLYKWCVDTIDMRLCSCSSTYYKNGILLPEIDRYKWIHISDIEHYMAKSMTRTLKQYFGI
jgi:8-oxo-dGTP pyrophosphatase MutT (NUDIX family)